MRGRVFILIAAFFVVGAPMRLAGAAERDPERAEPTELLDRAEFEGLAELAGAFIAQCRQEPARCSTREKADQLGRAFLVRAQALWRLDELVDGEAIANGFALIPSERLEWMADLPAIPDTGPSPWVLSLLMGIAGQIPIDIPGRVDHTEQPDPVELAPPAAPPPPPPMVLPPIRLFSWFGIESMGQATAFGGSHAGIGYDGHYRIKDTPLALATQLSMRFISPLGGLDPRVDWYALGGLRLSIAPGTERRAELEVDLLIGPSNHSGQVVGRYMVNGVEQDGFVSLRANVRFLADVGLPRLRLGPIARLETQPVFVLRREQSTDGTVTTVPRLRWNGHWALGGAGMQIRLERGAALQLQVAVGAAVWGDHTLGSGVVSVRFGMAFGEGLEP